MMEENAFNTVLANATCEGLKDALGNDVLQILMGRGLLDNVGNPTELDSQLRLLFGNGSRVLERLVVKELYRELSIPYNSASWFDYGKSLEVAKEACYVRARVK